MPPAAVWGHYTSTGRCVHHTLRQSGFAALVPVDEHTAPAPTVEVAPAPVVESFVIAPGGNAAPEPVVSYSSAEPIEHAATASVVAYTAPVPAVYAPTPVVESISLEPGYISPAHDR